MRHRDSRRVMYFGSRFAFAIFDLLATIGWSFTGYFLLKDKLGVFIVTAERHPKTTQEFSRCVV